MLFDENLSMVSEHVVPSHPTNYWLILLWNVMVLFIHVPRPFQQVHQIWKVLCHWRRSVSKQIFLILAGSKGMLDTCETGDLNFLLFLSIPYSLINLNTRTFLSNNSRMDTNKGNLSHEFPHVRHSFIDPPEPERFIERQNTFNSQVLFDKMNSSFDQNKIRIRRKVTYFSKAIC